MDLGKTLAVRRETVDDGSAGQRIDNFLARVCKGVPKSHLYRILRSGEVRVNGGRVSQTYRLKPGDEVRIPPIRQADRDARPAVPVGQPFQVAWEDDALLIIDKPAGLAVHGGSGVSFGVIEQLRRQRPEARFLELAHRLDRETSGLLIVAKKRSALTVLHDRMRDGGIGKRYQTLVAGRWMNPRQHMRQPLLKFLTAEGERRVRVDRDGKPAHSVVTLLRRWQTCSQLEVELKTGRTHQIRVHLAGAGYPLLGDDKYGDFALNKQLERDGLKRMFLHAWRLDFRHPLSDAPISVTAPLPLELEQYLAAVEQREERDHG
ncbi:MAG: RluA family pseudouridine synthase [Rhodocyclaceae bacterium]|nr:RluA family pseudouridine synthase [Rhodocyclaceae bacterium]